MLPVPKPSDPQGTRRQYRLYDFPIYAIVGITRSPRVKHGCWCKVSRDSASGHHCRGELRLRMTATRHTA